MVFALNLRMSRQIGLNIVTITGLQFASQKLSSLILVSLGLKGKEFRFEKGNILRAHEKKSAHMPKMTNDDTRIG